MGAAAGTNMMYAGTGLQFLSGLLGGWSQLQGANTASAAYSYYDQEAQLYEQQAETWANYDLSPFYDRQAEVYMDSAFSLLEGAMATANALETQARAKDAEADVILQVGEFNATSAEIDAVTSERRTYRQLEQVQDEAAKLLGRQVTMVAKAGVTQNSGSVVDILMETVYEAERQLRDITVEGRLEAAKIRLGGEIARIDAFGAAAQAKASSGNAFANASSALYEGVAASKGAVASARNARMQGYMSILTGSMRSQEARTQARITRLRGFRESSLLAQRMRWGAYGSFFGAGANLLTGLGRIGTR